MSPGPGNNSKPLKRSLSAFAGQRPLQSSFWEVPAYPEKYKKPLIVLVANKDKSSDNDIGGASSCGDDAVSSCSSSQSANPSVSSSNSNAIGPSVAGSSENCTPSANTDVSLKNKTDSAGSKGSIVSPEVSHRTRDFGSSSKCDQYFIDFALEGCEDNKIKPSGLHAGSPFKRFRSNND